MKRLVGMVCLMLLPGVLPGCAPATTATVAPAVAAGDAAAMSDGFDPTGLTVRKAPAIGWPFVAGTFIPLRDYGYERHEFFYGGKAQAYCNAAPLTSDGCWAVAPAESAAYRTRMLVYRPSDPAAFNGTVVVEWLNVSSGMDTAPDWLMMHTEMLRRGYAWVGISAQAMGVEGGQPALSSPVGLTLPLKRINWLRYRGLSHPGDSFSYDIFGQGARLVRQPGGIAPLGELTGAVRHVIAAGESQSASRLVTFINAFGPQAGFIDGYFVHSRTGSVPDLLEEGAAAPLSQAPQACIATPEVVRLRADLGKPVMNLQTETDSFVLNAHASRQPDSAFFRLWEVAGAAHADYYLMNRGLRDGGNDVRAAAVTITRRPIPIGAVLPYNVNAAPQHHFVANAALAALNRWVADGVLPPSAPRFEVAADGFRFDEYGNVLGGVRTPYVDAPAARFSGRNSSAQRDDIFFLVGATELLADDTLKALYPDHRAYVAAVAAAAGRAVAAGFLLSEDAALIIGAAEQGNIPPR